MKELNLLKLDEKNLRAREKKINDKYVCKYLVSIVEEPEQNLFPSSQRLLLNSLLAYNNGNNMLVMTTHSPYLINYLSLAVKADGLKEKVKTDELKSRLSDIVPLSATINPNDLVIYELDEINGSIKKLGNFEGIPSDKNFLNNSLSEGNYLFDSLLEIEEEL